MKKSILLALLSAVPFIALAQSPKAAKCEVFRPEVLNKNIIFEHEATKIGPSNRYGQSTRSTEL